MSAYESLEHAPIRSGTLRPEEVWETARLRARPASRADADVVFERYASDPAVAHYMTWRPHLERGETLEFLARAERGWAEGSAFLWTLWSKDDGELAGVIEARVRGHTVELGYALCSRLWRRGLMSEAVAEVVRWSLAQPGIFRVMATCDVENAGSAGVLERVGMRREGVLRRWIVHPNLSSEPRDALCYAIVREAAQERPV